MKHLDENPPGLPVETAQYENDPFELGEIDDAKLVEVKDFLPRPEELVFRPKGVKVTITLSEDSLNYFKEQARRLNTLGQSRTMKFIVGIRQNPWVSGKIQS